jgi:hypothetical protein
MHPPVVKTFALILTTVAVLPTFCAESAQVRQKPATLWKPPSIGVSQNLPPATIHNEVIKTVRVAGMQIVLDETRWEAAQQHLGATIGHSGDAGDSLKWMCFHGADSKAKWIFWLQSNEVNGDNVGGFQWQLLERGQQPDPRCQDVAHEGHAVELPIRLQLGMTEAEVKKILGAPTVRRGGLLTYFHEHQITIDKSPYTASSIVDILLSDGRVSAIQGWKTTVN